MCLSSERQFPPGERLVDLLGACQLLSNPCSMLFWRSIRRRWRASVLQKILDNCCHPPLAHLHHPCSQSVDALAGILALDVREHDLEGGCPVVQVGARADGLVLQPAVAAMLLEGPQVGLVVRVGEPRRSEPAAVFLGRCWKDRGHCWGVRLSKGREANESRTVPIPFAPKRLWTGGPAVVLPPMPDCHCLG